MTYAESRGFGAAIVEETKARVMPPWHAENTDECTVPLLWKDDTRLSDAQLATLAGLLQIKPVTSWASAAPTTTP